MVEPVRFPEIDLYKGWGEPLRSDWVLALGQPFGLQDTVTAGIISAKDRGIGPKTHSIYRTRLIQIELLQPSVPIHSHTPSCGECLARRRLNSNQCRPRCRKLS